MKYHEGEKVTLYHGDNREVMRTLPDASVDAIVCDPPYELGFMGKKWDASGIAYSVEMWQDALRVLKPGGHLLAFSGSRTYHRMTVAIEDAGFEIRDQIMWIYGSGFPKSLDISKAIDKTNGEVGRLLKFTAWMRTTGLTAKQLNELTGTMMGGHYLTLASQPAIPTVELWQRIRPHIAEVPEWVDELVERIEAEREVVGKGSSTLISASGTYAVTNGEKGEVWKAKEYDITAPATTEAKAWAGWGTALKPAHEPVVVARKPLIGTVAENVLTYGTGGLNIDGTRVAMGDEYDPTRMQRQQHSSGAIDGAFGAASLIGTEIQTYKEGGRWPANVIHDGSDEVVELFPHTAATGSGKVSGFRRGGASENAVGLAGVKKAADGFSDSGSAARFFYCAKASKKDRNEGLEGFPLRQSGIKNESGRGFSETDPRREILQHNHHPTVKPTDLMRYLCRLVTPPNGIILDPFMGSGSTGKAAVLEGFQFIGIEMTDDYLPIAKARIEWATTQGDDDLFGGAV